MPETHTSGRPAFADPLELPSLSRPSIEGAIAESEIRGDIPATLQPVGDDVVDAQYDRGRELGPPRTRTTRIIGALERSKGRVNSSATRSPQL